MMKKTTALSVMLFLAVSSFGQWEWLNPRPSGQTATKILFTDNLHGFIMTANGDLQTTSDQGNSWNFQQNFGTGNTMDIKDSTAIISGYGYVYISQNNGQSWALKSMGVFENFKMAKVVSKDTIFIASDLGNGYRSDDRGQTWKKFSCGIPISSIDFVNSKIGYAGGTDYQILKTEDGGLTWKPIVSVGVFPSNTLAIKFIDVNTGFAFRSHSDLLSTTDGGKTWKTYYMGDDIYSFYFVSKMIGFACGETGVTYRTDDGGLTWNWISLTGRIGQYDLYSIYFLNANTGFTVGNRGRILKTSDGGQTWKTYSPTYLDVGAMSIPTKNIAYATVGNTIYKSGDAGKTWNQLSLTVGDSYAEYDMFQTCHFFSADTGFVTASDNARLYKTYDGGLNWKQVAVSPYGNDDITCIQFTSKYTGYLAIDNYTSGKIVKTVDGGETWNEVWTSQYYGEVFNKFHFISEKKGFASREDRLFRTDDSARTWTEVWNDELITAIWFINPQTGFVVGQNGMLKRTDNGGSTWTKVQPVSQYYDDIYNIKFINDQLGYFTAEGGAIYKTTDAGKTWKAVSKGSYHEVRTIEFAPDSMIYVAGQSGAILRSDVSEYSFESYSMSRTADCKTELKATINTIYSSLDSIQFEYGLDFINLDHRVMATPSKVANGRQQVVGIIPSYPPSTEFTMRVKMYYRGEVRYGNKVTLTTWDKPQTPVISTTNGGAFCEGDSLVLTSSFSTSNNWLYNGVAIAGAINRTFVARQPGLYQLMRGDNCNPSDTTSITLTTKPVVLPALSISYSGCASDTLHFQAIDTNGGANPQYHWFVNGIDSGAGPTFTLNDAVNNAEVLCKLISDAVCAKPASVEDSVIINCTITSSPDIDGLEELTVSPNPAQKSLYVNLKLNQPKKISYNLFNIAGIKLYELQPIRRTGSVTQQIDISKFPPGLYFLNITVDKQTVTRKVIKVD